MIDRAHDLPVTRQAAVLNISRGSVYYLPRAIPAGELAIMRRQDPAILRRDRLDPFANCRQKSALVFDALSKH